MRWPLLETLAILAPLSLISGLAQEEAGRGMKTFLALIGMFGSLSLLSIGGGNTVLPDMHLQAVTGHHWLTNSQFADIFRSPRPRRGDILIVALVGYAAGLGVAGGRRRHRRRCTGHGWQWWCPRPP